MIKSYKLFTTPTCPSCPPVKEFMGGVEMEGEKIDAGTPEGLKEAQRYGIRAVPTVLFFDEKGEVFKEASSVDEIKEVLKQDKT